jgi:hypothetical protein
LTFIQLVILRMKTAKYRVFMLSKKQCFGSAPTLGGSGSSKSVCGSGSSFENECGSMQIRIWVIS